MAKSTRSEPKPTESHHEPAVYDTEGRLRMVADGLSATFESLTADLHGNGEHPSAVSDIARIGTALTTTLAELRQHAKIAGRAIESIPIERIVAHLKTLDSEQRGRVCREISDDEDTRSVL